MSLDELAALLGAYAAGEVGLETVHQRLLPVLAADPLQVEESDSEPWDTAHADARLFWRLTYLIESEAYDADELRRVARRVVACLQQTGSAELTFELLPLVLDQDRFATILDRHHRGIISRTGLLSVLAESGYPPHVKLWLERAGRTAQGRLAADLAGERYDAVAAAFEGPPLG